MEKLKLVLTFVVIIGAIALGFYWLSKDAEQSKSDRIEAMRHGYSYSKGVISAKHSYKAQTIEVKYQIDGVEYKSIRNWHNNPRNLGVGDSISFKYAIDNPEMMITELESGY